MNGAIGMAGATAVERATMASRDLRRARVRRLGLAFAIWVGAPTLLATVYYGSLASPEYESIAVLAVDAGPPSAEDVASAGKNGVHAAELEAIAARLRSRSARAKLTRDQDWLEHVQDRRIDWWSRLRAGADAERTQAYYESKVAATVDAKGATLTLAVRGFSADRARRFARALVRTAEHFVDQMSAPARRELTESADAAVTSARERLVHARSVAAGAGSDSPANLDVEIARQQLASALHGAEQVALEVARRHHHLVVVAEPSLPGAPSYPRRFWSIATVFVCALVLMGVVFLLVAMVREHAQM